MADRSVEAAGEDGPPAVRPGPLPLHAGLLAVAQGAGAALGFAVAIVEARLLGPTGFGVAALALAYPTLIFSALAVKSASVITRYLAQSLAAGRHEQTRAVCRLGYGLDGVSAVAAFLVVAASGGWVSRVVYGAADVYPLMVAYAASFPLTSLAGTSVAILQSGGRFAWLAGHYVLLQLLTLGIVGSLLAGGLGVPGMVVGTAAGQMAAALAIFTAATRVLVGRGVGLWWQGPTEGVRRLRGELTPAFAWNYITVTMSGAVAEVPVLLLGRFHGAAEAGFFRLASAFSAAGAFLETSLNRVVYPQLSRWEAGRPPGDLLRQVRMWTRQVGVPAGALVLAGALAVPPVVRAAFGPTYAPVAFGVQIMLLGVAASTMLFWLTPLFYASGQVVARGKVYTGVAALLLAAAWPVARWGRFLGLAALSGGSRIVLTAVLLVLFLRGAGARAARAGR